MIFFSLSCVISGIALQFVFLLKWHEKSEPLKVLNVSDEDALTAIESRRKLV